MQINACLVAHGILKCRVLQKPVGLQLPKIFLVSMCNEAGTWLAFHSGLNIKLFSSEDLLG
jgi:hypothetical protein